MQACLNECFVVQVTLHPCFSWQGVLQSYACKTTDHPLASRCVLSCLPAFAPLVFCLLVPLLLLLLPLPQGRIQAFTQSAALVQPQPGGTFSWFNGNITGARSACVDHCLHLGTCGA